MSKTSLMNTNAKRSAKHLKRLQNLPLEQKVNLSLRRIRDFINKCGGDTYVSFSGGKDSTVLLDLVRQIDPKIKGVFADTGLEFPEIKDFVKSIENVEWIRPEMSFNNVIKNYGYPLISKEQAQYIEDVNNTKSEKLKNIRMNGNKHNRGKVSDKWKYLLNTDIKITSKCCDIMKKRPFKKFETAYKKTNKKSIYSFVGIMAGESSLRFQTWLDNGCNAFDNKMQSRPLMFWSEEDIWEYIKTRNLSYSNIYDMGYKRTGCVFCAFGAHLEIGENRFQMLEKTHPKLHEYCMESKGDYGLGMRRPLEIIGVETRYQPTLFDNK